MSDAVVAAEEAGAARTTPAHAAALLVALAREGEDLSALEGCHPAAVMVRPSGTDLRRRLLDSPPEEDTAVVLVGWEPLRDGLSLAAAQSGAAAVVCLLPAGSLARLDALSPDARRAVSEGLVFADRILVAEDGGGAAATGVALARRFPHAAGRFVPARVPLPAPLLAPPGSPDPRAVAAAARLFASARPEFADPESPAPLPSPSRAPLPLRAVGVLKRRGLAYALKAAWARLRGGKGRTR